jgi:ATP-dependent exoDNAse (exonuclease V) alpha subunit
MISDELVYRIREAFNFEPTAEQQEAMDVFARFMYDRRDDALMVMRGSAGTGKTTLAAAMVGALRLLNQQLVLLAPTGRAAKVFSLYAHHAAYTIHRRIYRQKSLEGGFSLGYNNAHDTLFIVDEASMIANGETPLLDDLLSFVYNQRNCRLLLIGDAAQLPPVGEQQSPALSADVLCGYGMHVYQCTLNEVLRQSQQSGILFNATRIRQLHAQPLVTLPQIRFQGFTDIHVVTGDELIETLASSYSHVGLDETIVVTRSNKRANIYNQGIRNMILGREDLLTTGDQVMIVKNNYYWTKDADNLEFLANGDHAVVRRVRNIHELYGFQFAEVTMTLPDYDDYELTALVILDTLTSEAPALTREQQEQLFQQVMNDYADVPSKRERLKKLKEDRYYNALQIKFAYAATCHKAQGGQWSHVYVDQGYMTDDMLGDDYLHWLYTAFTRATQQLYLVNWPEKQKSEK